MNRNLHNPYPTTREKRDIARVSGVSVSEVSKMFKQARERIGWTRLLSDYFYGSRVQATTAASAYFLEKDGNTPILSKIAAEFCAMKAKTLRMLHNSNSLSDSDYVSSISDSNELSCGAYQDNLRRERRLHCHRDCPLYHH